MGFRLCAGLLLLVVGEVVGGGGGHKRGNLLHGHSALAQGDRALPFDAVNALPPAHPARPSLGVDHHLVRGVPESGAAARLVASGAVGRRSGVNVSWSGVVAATADDLIVLTCADRPGWGLTEGFDAVATTGRKGKEAIPSRTNDLRSKAPGR